MQYSPLCYPGSKKQLVPVIKNFMTNNNINKPIFCESHCGGASIGLELLMNGDIEKLVLNDLDIGIVSFWVSVLNETDNLIYLIENTPINIEEWKKQRESYNTHSNLLALGFATFYLNRTNFSGIIKGGIRGGFKQLGEYLIDCRFNKKELINKIEKIAQFRNKIEVLEWNAKRFIPFVDDLDNVFIYIDPPYYKQGKKLYTKYYQDKDHLELEKCIRNIKNKWLLSYDKCDFIKDLYRNYSITEHSFLYAANGRKIKNELLISNKVINEKRK